jgi:hypothetical protein
MDQTDGDGAFANSGGDALYVARTNVADREDTRPARFQHLDRGKPGCGLSHRVHVLAREDEALVVKGQASAQPIGSWRCAGHDENVANLANGRLAGCVSPSDAFEVLSSLQICDLSFIVQVDLGILVDAFDEIARHRVRKLAGTYQHVDFGGSLGEKNGGLPSRIPATDDHDLFPIAQLRLHTRRAVVDALPLKPLEVWNRWPGVLRSGGDDDGPRGKCLAVVESDFVRAPPAIEADGIGRYHQIGPEFFGLCDRTRRQFQTGNADREPQVVLDLRT